MIGARGDDTPMTTETTETTETTARPLVKDLDDQVRIAYLASLVGRRVRYALTREVTPLQRAFGEYMTMPWLTGRLMALTLIPTTIFSATPAGPAIKVERTPTTRYLSLGGLNPPLEHTIVIADLYDVEDAERREPAQPATQLDPPDPRGFGCEDLFEENEIGCPHCGHTLRVTLQATVRLADDEEDADGEETTQQ